MPTINHTAKAAKTPRPKRIGNQPITQSMSLEVESLIWPNREGQRRGPAAPDARFVSERPGCFPVAGSPGSVLVVF